MPVSFHSFRVLPARRYQALDAIIRSLLSQDALLSACPVPIFSQSRIFPHTALIRTVSANNILRCPSISPLVSRVRQDSALSNIIRRCSPLNAGLGFALFPLSGFANLHLLHMTCLIALIRRLRLPAQPARYKAVHQIHAQSPAACPLYRIRASPFDRPYLIILHSLFPCLRNG